MRYRPLARSGSALSCVSLVLTDQPMRDADRVRLVYSALEAGVNTFELQSRDPEIAASLGEALSAVERHMVFVALRIGSVRDRNGRKAPDFSAQGLTGLIESTLMHAKLDRIDVAVVDAPETGPLPDHVIPALEAARATGRVRMLGIAGADSVDPYLDLPTFEVLATGFNIQSGWRERNRLKRAVQGNMAIIGSHYQPFVAPMEEEKVGGPLVRMLGKRKDMNKVETGYAFLERTPGWTPEEICLGYALTEPSLTTVQTGVRDAEHLQKLAAVVERDLPAGVAAQIEMARFSLGDAG